MAKFSPICERNLPVVSNIWMLLTRRRAEKPEIKSNKAQKVLYSYGVEELLGSESHLSDEDGFHWSRDQ